MTLTAEQLRAAASGKRVRFADNGIEFVVVRSEWFDRMEGLLEAEHDELRAMLAHSCAANGWDEPDMDAYDSYPAER